MNRMRSGAGVLLVLTLLLWAGAARAQDAKFYELTENMKLISKGHQPIRAATSWLMGFAAPGTPVCPAVYAQPVPERGTDCTINITGSNEIVLTTGLGTLVGSFTVVVQDDNPVDGPELVVMRGKLKGMMDFSPALIGIPHLGKVPFGTVDGTLTTDGGARIPFWGTFRLPFLGSFSDRVLTWGATLRQIYCPQSPKPNPNLLGPDIAYIDTKVIAGVMVPTGTCSDVQPDELSLGYPTVRFDIVFTDRGYSEPYSSAGSHLKDYSRGY